MDEVKPTDTPRSYLGEQIQPLIECFDALIVLYKSDGGESTKIAGRIYHEKEKKALERLPLIKELIARGK